MDRLFQMMQFIPILKPALSISICLSFALLMTSACTQLPQVNESPMFSNSPSPYRSAILFAQEFSKLALEEQRIRIVQLNRTSPQDVKTKLQLAMAYGLPSSRLRDQVKAQSLIDELMKDASLDNETVALVGLINDYMAELNKANQKTKDEQKRADNTQQKLDDLQKKLDDLKHIEKTMVDRDQGVKK
jgi:hypothetical protein